MPWDGVKASTSSVKLRTRNLTVMVLNCLGMTLNASGKVFGGGGRVKCCYYSAYSLLYFLSPLRSHVDILFTARGATGPALISRGCALGWSEKQPKSLWATDK
jgi:hypothetical protein